MQQPHAFNAQQYNHVLYQEELATATQVELEEVTLLCLQHFSTFHITAQQSVCYMHS
jgi:surface antigen